MAKKTLFFVLILSCFLSLALSISPGVLANEECNSFITGQAINASGDPVSDQNLNANPRNQYGEHTSHGDFNANESGHFNLTGLCYGQYYSIMFQDDAYGPSNVNWSVIQALGQDIGIINISQQFGNLYGRVWLNETAEINATFGEVEFYNDRQEFIWVGGFCGPQDPGCQNEGMYYELLPEGDYYIRAVSADKQNWGRVNVSQGLVYVSLTAGSDNETNLTANITGTVIELGAMALDGTEKGGVWVNITNKDDGTILKKRLVNQSWGDVMVQFFMSKDSLFNVSVYDPVGTYPTKDISDDYNTTSVGRLYFTLWNNSLAPASNSSINGIVIDPSGQALENATVKAIIMRIYDPSHWDKDPEGWVWRDWRNAVINSTLTDASGNFELTLPTPAGDFVRYAIVSYWDNSSTPGADYVKEYDRNGWRGYDFSGGRQINDSIIELKPGATIKLNIYQPDGQARINSSWVENTYGEGDRLWRVYSLKAEKKPWGYEWEDYEAAEVQGGNFEDKSIFTINAPLGRNVLIGGTEISRYYFKMNPGANFTYACVTNYTVQSFQQGSIIEMNCNMTEHYKMEIDVSGMEGEFLVMSPDDGLPLFPDHGKDSSSFTIPLRNDSLYNLTFMPRGPPTFSEIYNVNVSENNYIELDLEESKYHMDVEIPESMSPNVEYTIRAFPMGKEGMLAGLNMSYDIYYGNESFYRNGEVFVYQNISFGPKTKEYYNSTINITEPGSYMITVKAGIYNETEDIYTYTREERDAEVWNLRVDIFSEKWSFMRGDDVLLFIRAFNTTTKQPVYNANYTVAIYDYERRKEYSMVSSTVLTNNDDTKVSFTIPQYLPEGWYRTTVTVSNETENFKGNRNLHFHLTNMNFGVRFEKFELAPDENQTIYIVARDRAGLPVANMNVTIEDVMTGYTASGDTDQDGMLTLTIPSSSYDGMYGYHEIEIRAFSPDGKKEKTFDGFVVIPVKLFIEPNGKTKFVPGENLTWEAGIVSMEDGLLIPPPFECFIDEENWNMEDTCDAPGPFQGQVYSSFATTVNKGDLIAGPPIDIKIYYPNGSLYYEENLGSDMGEMVMDNPLYGLTHIGAGDVPGTYKVGVTLDNEITTHMSYKVRTVELKAYPEKSKYILSNLEYNRTEIVINIEALNYSTGKPVPISGSNVNAMMYNPSGMNITPDIQDTTDSNGRTKFNFSSIDWWSNQGGGVFRVLLNFTDTGDIREVYFKIYHLIAGLKDPGTSLELGDSFTANATFVNTTFDNLWTEDIGFVLDNVVFTLTLPDGMEYQYYGQKYGIYYWAQINISEDFPSGPYMLSVYGEIVDAVNYYAWSGFNETRFRVGGYELDVFLNREGKPEYSLDEEAEVIARLIYSNGTPIQGAVLTYELFDERKHTFKDSMTATATDSDGMTSLTYGPATADVEISKDGVYTVKVKYKSGNNIRAKEGITFIITGINVDLTTDEDEYTTGDDLLINVTASKQGSPVYNGSAMAMIIPPGRAPYPVWSFTETVLAGSTVYSINISGLLQVSGMYFIMAGVDDINGSFGGDAREIFVQDFNLTFETENMTYTESDNVTLIINASNTSSYINGSFEVELFRKGAGQVNDTSGSIEGNTTLTFLNMTPGAYMAEIRMTADNGDKAIATAKFGVRSSVAYSMTTKDASNVTRSYFTTSEAVNIDIGPSIPSDSSVVMVAPDGSKASLPADSSTVTVPASQKPDAGWYLLRLESDTGITYATSMFKVKT